MEIKLPKAWLTWRAIPETDPKRLAKMAEAGIRLRNARKELEAQAAAIGAEEDALKDVMINTFEKSALEEVKTSLGVARLQKKTIPVMDPTTGGWDAIYKYVVKNKAWDIIQKRLGEKACQARWEDGKEIPGVKRFEKVDIKLGDAE